MFVFEFIAGTVGGWAQVFAGHPFDTVKVRLQTEQHRFKNGVDCLQQTVKKEGVTALYKGVTSPLMGIGFCNAVAFSANGFGKRNLSDNYTKPLTLGTITASGVFAGACMSFTNCPVELIKVQLQTQYGHAPAPNQVHYSGVFDCARKLVAQHGLATLYRGWVPTFLRDAPSFGAYFLTYEYLKLRVEEKNKGPITAGQAMLAGGLAGISCWMSCYPQDVIKSRMQKDKSYKGVIDCAKAIFREQGWKGFFRGFGPTILRAFPANAATFLAYEFTMNNLKALNHS